MRTHLAVAAILLHANAAAIAGQSRTRVHLVVGPNILVSTNPGVMLEPMLAASPVDAKTLIAVGIASEPADHVVSYTSHDGGNSWKMAEMPLEWSGDPQIAFGPTGMAYFVALGARAESDRDSTDLDPYGVFMARSSDAGAKWQRPAHPETGMMMPDHPQLVVDRSGGRFDGRAYATAQLGMDLDGIAVFHTADTGRTWSDWSIVPGTGSSFNTTNPLVLSDGTLWVSVHERTGGYDAAHADSARDAFALSTDGGVTFSEPHAFHIVTPARPHPEGRDGPFPEYAVDGSAAHRDRIYMVYTQRIAAGGADQARVVLQHSDDRGLTWSTARAVDPAAPRSAEQFQQMVAVSREGIVGVSWFDGRSRSDGLGFDQYFAASMDGGETFVPAVRVSTITSVPRTASSFHFAGQTAVANDTLYFSASGSLPRVDIGGDYMGLAVDLDGVFHAVWTDAREGVYRLYTAAIHIAQDTTPATPKPATRVRALSPSEFSVAFETGTYDPVSDVVSIPMRFRNVSTHPLYGPLTLRLDQKDGPFVPPIGAPVAVFPIVLGAANGKTGSGAEFDLSSLLGDPGLLSPGDTTGVFVLKMRQPTPGDHDLGRMMMILSAAVP